MRKIFFPILILLLILGLAGGCDCPLSDGELQANTVSGYDVTDDLGNVVHMKRKPTHVITNHFHLDNIVLGLVPESRVAAVTDAIDDSNISFKEEGLFKNVKRYKGSLSLEMVAALRPDLIIVKQGTAEDMIDAYKGMGIPVFVSRTPNSVKELIHELDIISKVLGEPDAGNCLITKVKSSLNEIKDNISPNDWNRKSCLLVSKMNINYGGKGCFFDDMCNYAGVMNAAGEIGVKNGEPITREVIISSNPDTILLSSSWEIKHAGQAAYKDEFKSDPALNFLPAVRTNHVFYIQDKYLYAANQNCVWAVRKIASLVYGDEAIFPSKEESFLRGY